MRPQGLGPSLVAGLALLALAGPGQGAGYPDFVIAPEGLAVRQVPDGAVNPAQAWVDVTVRNQGAAANAAWYLVLLVVCEDGAAPRACAGIAAVGTDLPLEAGASETFAIKWYTAGAVGDVRVCALAFLPEEPWTTNGDNLATRAVGVPVTGLGLSRVEPNHVQTYALEPDWC